MSSYFFHCLYVLIARPRWITRQLIGLERVLFFGCWRHLSPFPFTNWLGFHHQSVLIPKSRWHDRWACSLGMEVSIALLPFVIIYLSILKKMSWDSCLGPFQWKQIINHISSGCWTFESIMQYSKMKIKSDRSTVPPAIHYHVQLVNWLVNCILNTHQCSWGCKSQLTQTSISWIGKVLGSFEGPLESVLHFTHGSFQNQTTTHISFVQSGLLISTATPFILSRFMRLWGVNASTQVLSWK